MLFNGNSTVVNISNSLIEYSSLTYIMNFCLGDVVTPQDKSAPHKTMIHIRRRFQFSSALKRMSTISSLANGRTLIAVKGAPETIRGMLTTVPEFYDRVYKQYTKQGSRVLALGCKEIEGMGGERVCFDLFLPGSW